MSNAEDTKPTPPDPQPPAVRFRQLCRMSDDTLFALSEEGVVYRQEYSEDADLTLWRRLGTMTSTQLVVRPCSYPDCEYLIEKLPEEWATITKPPSCDLHRYRV